MQKKNLQIVLVIGVLISALAFYIYQDLYTAENLIIKSSIATTTVQVKDTDVKVTVGLGEEKGIEIKEITKEEVPIPDLDREISFPEWYPEDAQKIRLDKINTVVQDIKNNPDSYDDWMSLGLQIKAVEDYKGAELAWEYAKYLNPDKFLAWSNLGDLNAYYLKDNIKAEENYIKALERGGHQIPTYFKVVEFYRDFLNNTEKAIQIAELGLEHNPSSEDLQNLLNSLK